MDPAAAPLPDPALIPLLPIALFLPVSEAMSLGCIGLMIAWAWRYGSREMAQIEVTPG